MSEKEITSMCDIKYDDEIGSIEKLKNDIIKCLKGISLCDGSKNEFERITSQKKGLNGVDQHLVYQSEDGCLYHDKAALLYYLFSTHSINNFKDVINEIIENEPLDNIAGKPKKDLTSLFQIPFEASGHFFGANDVHYEVNVSEYTSDFISLILSYLSEINANKFRYVMQLIVGYTKNKEIDSLWLGIYYLSTQRDGTSRLADSFFFKIQ